MGILLNEPLSFNSLVTMDDRKRSKNQNSSTLQEFWFRLKINRTDFSKFLFQLIRNRIWDFKIRFRLIRTELRQIKYGKKTKKSIGLRVHIQQLSTILDTRISGALRAPLKILAPAGGMLASLTRFLATLEN